MVPLLFGSNRHHPCSRAEHRARPPGAPGGRRTSSRAAWRRGRWPRSSGCPPISGPGLLLAAPARNDAL